MKDKSEIVVKLVAGVIIAAFAVLLCIAFGLVTEQALISMAESWKKQNHTNCLSKCGAIPDENRRKQCYRLCDKNAE